MGRKPATSLAPGFRFHPTDEELVRYYLRRKVCKKGFLFDAIAFTDVYKSEPWELPGKSKLKSRDLEWYFFSMLDRKYSNGSKTNRATENGYWKTTGKDRPVTHKGKLVGMKKTLVYHRGRAPHGVRSNWVMHEYRLIDEDLEKAGVLQDTFVLCRIFQKSGTGPKNGEQYGAPFEEEEWEWDDEEVTMVPGEDQSDQVVISDQTPYPEVEDVYTEVNDLQQNVDSGVSLEPPPAFEYYNDDSSQYLNYSDGLFEDGQKPFIGTREYNDSNLLEGEPCFDVLDVLEPYEDDDKPVKEERFVESGENPLDASFLIDEPYLDAFQEPVPEEGLFLETNDLSNHVEPDPSSFDMLDEYIKYFETDDVNTQFFNSSLLETESSIVANEPIVNQKAEEAIDHTVAKTKLVPNAHGSDVASSSNQNSEDTKFESDYKYPFVNMLGKKSAPYSFSTKDALLRLASSAQSPSSIHVTAGMVQIRNTDAYGNRLSWTLDKNGNIEVVLSLTLPQVDTTALDILAKMVSRKTSSAVSRACFYLIILWVIIVSISFKIASLVHTK